MALSGAAATNWKFAVFWKRIRLKATFPTSESLFSDLINIELVFYSFNNIVSANRMARVGGGGDLAPLKRKYISLLEVRSHALPRLFISQNIIKIYS